MISGYRFLHDIGHGGFSTVHLAEQEIFDRRVAVKIMHADLRDPDAERRFVRECRATGRLTGNRHIITVFDAGTTSDHRPYIAMEYFPGGTLSQRLRESGPLPVREAVALMIPITRALGAAHRHGILHRDLKPANILLRGPGDPVLSDFGIASVGEGADAATVSAAFTAGYAAPEVMLGEQPGIASDVFALGATLFALLNGSTPFPGRTVVQIVARIQADDMESTTREDIPVRLTDLLRRMLAAEPTRRPGTEQIAAELDAVLAAVDAVGAPAGPFPDASDRLPGQPPDNQVPGQPRPPRRTTPRQTTPRRRFPPRWVLLAGPVALLALAALLLVVLTGGGTDQADGTSPSVDPGATQPGTSPGAGLTTGPTPPSGPSSSPGGGPAGTSPGPAGPAGSCGYQAATAADYRDRRFEERFMCATSVDSPVYANVATDDGQPLDDSGLMRASTTVWVICQLEGRPNPVLDGRTNTWWLYTQGDLARPNAFGYTGSWGYLPATAVRDSVQGEPVGGVPACPGPL
ncbi:serine/threonine protein kinase [Parafrankia soli]|uniref:non-specific serine/threonine protein kinase n=1 Tax=Parafrankia soli TaxID=2599596 RepID=A0A1S1RC89_9ACTN|nr:serine/threonine-protein kinase [Parafrankia soli]ABW10101.1 serine/threonine protein kinase [Frankia sp. EAN1pec]OHV43065.1 serine/threonine protein kinase [Parafrankia soli]